MSVDIRGIEEALVKTVRAWIGDRLSSTGSNQIIWQDTGLGVVTNPSHVFSNVSRPLCEVDRDTYFTTNPLELIEGVTCTLQFSGDDIIQTYQSTNKASVIRSRLYSEGSQPTTPTFPDYPYASVDYTRITDEGFELSSRFFNDEGDYVYRTHKLASYSIKFFGTSIDDVLGLANRMHMLFEIDQVRDQLTALSPTEVRLRSKSDIVFVASAMEDKYREIASFDVILAVLDEVSIPDVSAEYFSNIEMNTEVPVDIDGDLIQGGIYEDPDESPELHVNVNTNLP